MTTPFLRSCMTITPAEPRTAGARRRATRGPQLNKCNASGFSLAGSTVALAFLPFAAAADPALETESARLSRAGSWLVASAVEVQTANEGEEVALPVIIEYGLRDDLELLIEPVPYTGIFPRHGRQANGPGDLELTLTYRLSPETDVLPAFAVAAEVKLPTARNDLIGSGKTDATGYLIASKSFGDFDVHANAAYTFVGEPSGVTLDNTFSLALATTYRIDEQYGLFAEVFYTSSSIPEGTSEGGGDAGNPLLPAEISEDELFGTIGVRYRLSSAFAFTGSYTYDNNNASLFRFGLVFQN